MIFYKRFFSFTCLDVFLLVNQILLLLFYPLQILDSDLKYDILAVQSGSPPSVNGINLKFATYYKVPWLTIQAQLTKKGIVRKKLAFILLFDENLT